MSNTGIFVRCPVSVAERIRGAIIRENLERAAAKLDAFALYKGAPCLPPYFARAGERETERIESAACLLRGVPTIDATPPTLDREATLNVNFDVSPALAARSAAAIRTLNKALRSAKSEAICLRSGRPSLPQFFLRAGLLELVRDEARAESSSMVDTPPRAEVVRALLRRGPRGA